MKCLIFIGYLTVCFFLSLVIGQVKSDRLDLKQPMKSQTRAVNNQSYSGILLLTQLAVKLRVADFISNKTVTLSDNLLE